MSDVRWFIRVGIGDRWPFVRTYAGGDVTTTFNRWAALSWTDRALVGRLVKAIREVARVKTKIVRVTTTPKRSTERG